MVSPKDTTADHIDHPIVAWLILVYDRTAEERFPFQRKWYRFNFETAAKDEIANVLEILGHHDDNIAPPMADLAVGDLKFPFK